MTDFLLFRLYAPLASWGDIAVGEYRPTYTHPSKSAILGLLAAALGIRRNEEEEHRALAESYGFAVQVEAAGHLLRDFHTYSKPKGKKTYHTRRDELQASDLETKLSTRDYRCDALYTICLWQYHDEVTYSLQDLEEHLRYPKFTLYLGRKSCPLAFPVQAKVLSANTLQEAFERAEFMEPKLQELPKDEHIAFYWEEWTKPEQTGLQILQTISRRDVPLSRRRWQFTEREEHHAEQKRVS